ncbi:putative Exocyst complex component 5 [Hypsibius exemplaris]|uniref:Exocyst complex component 5 n=1 Tax=Hypsibius exemplaris TaxID=2072580 RepID=A0A1W0WFQ0_HYPEX|nr:putative Exocyst complex component 5 [Hypsibius exemplaris]
MAKTHSAVSIDAESLWHELLGVSFDVDEFLENYIKNRMVPSKNSLRVGSAIFLLDAVPQLRLKPISATAQPMRSFIDLHDSTFDTNRILSSLNDLFDACVFINSKAAYQHQHAEEELRHVEEEAQEKLMCRAEKVKLSLREVERLQAELKDLSRKLNHVGDKISSTTKPQERLLEAQKLLAYFIELDQAELPAQMTFPELLQKRQTLDDYQKAAYSVLSLQKVATALEAYRDHAYEMARGRITTLYEEIETELALLFSRGHDEMDLHLMQQVAVLLQSFPEGFNATIMNFVDRAVHVVANMSNDPFRHIIQVCDATYKLIYEVFPGPSSVMDKFITRVVCQELEPVIEAQLGGRTTATLEAYLGSFYDLYKRVQGLEPSLSKFKGFHMAGILHSLFDFHLQRYMETELRFLNHKCDQLLQQYYEVLATDLEYYGKLSPVKILPEPDADIFTMTIGASKPIPVLLGDFLANHPKAGYENKLVNETLCLRLLSELRQAANRVRTFVHTEDEVASNLLQLASVVINGVAMIHLDYGMEIGIRALPPSDPKTEPSLAFLRLVHHTAMILDLLEFQIRECLRRIERLQTETLKLDSLMQQARERIERKATIGIEGCLNAAMNYLRLLLSRQKKAEFSNLSKGFVATPTALKVADFFLKMIESVKENITGKNHHNVSAELGLRFHREIIDHLENFRFNNEEGMILICDVKEYRDVAFILDVDAVSKLFMEMLLLTNLLVGPGANLSVICKEILRDVESLESIGYFLRLREDFKIVSDSVEEYI